MDRSIRREPAEADLTELLQPARQRGVIGNGDLHLEHVGQGTQRPLDLPERKVEDHEVAGPIIIHTLEGVPFVGGIVVMNTDSEDE